LNTHSVTPISHTGAVFTTGYNTGIMGLEANIKQAVEALSQANLVAVSSGAGISKESGIPTFREAQIGLWVRYNPEVLATPSAFRQNPDLVWSWYMYRRGLVLSSTPNPGHHAIVKLESLVDRVVVLTQNIDGFHAESGSTDIVELHGNIRRYKCFGNCQGNPTIVDLDTLPHDQDHAPLCPHCRRAKVRPDVVWFGENLNADNLQRAFDIASTCDVILVVGTTGIVQPAASLPHAAKQSGATVIEVNPSESLITRIADIFLQGPSGEVLPKLVSALRAYRDREN
jgi:NAD-dependent deacetylase